nr:ATP-dependent RecD-like DNA helicase [Lachnospiraceae bacterium]
SEVTDCEAKTIHRLLEVEWTSGDKPVFKRNEQNTLSCDALILDEASMIDSLLLDSVMRAFPLGCRLILVGDSDQLPSVGAGNVLGDLIASGILPTVTLNEIFRQSMKSLIVTNAHRINKGEMPVIDVKNNDFFFLKCQNPSVMSDTILELCKTRLPRTYGYSPTDDIQVLSPSRKGDLGTVELNKALQNALNPESPEKKEIMINSRLMREGDKVMQYKNNYNILWTKEDGSTGEGVFNGDIGKLIEISKSNQRVKIKYDDKVASYTFDDMIDVDLAYCSTVHKSQGNEFEVVIIPMYNSPPQLLYRNLLYTAATRAKKLLILVGRVDIMERMVSNNRRTLRYSGLKEFLLRGAGTNDSNEGTAVEENIAVSSDGEP